MVTLALTDFSFAERAVIDVWIWFWFIIKVWLTDKFASLRWHKLRNFDLKSVITLLIFLMLPIQAVFDMSWTFLKYSEGLVVDKSGEIITKPSFDQYGRPLWAGENVMIKTITEYVLTFAFAFQIGTLALMQAFWSHLSSQMGGRPFMRSWEFRSYVSWVFISMVIFPAARFLSSFDFILIEAVPSFVFSIQLFIIFLLGIINGKRLNDLLTSIRQNTSSSGQETIRRIHYFIEMNKLLMLGTLLISIPFSIISLDAFAIHKLVQKKFWLDLLLIHANFGSLILWVTMILIIYPRYYITGTILSNSHLKSISVVSLGTGNAPKGELENNTPQNSLVVAKTTKTTTTTAATTNTKTPFRARENSIEKSINNLLEEQKHQIANFRHKTSMSISSTTTLASNHAPSSPLISPSSASRSLLFPPPAAYER